MRMSFTVVSWLATFVGLCAGGCLLSAGCPALLMICMPEELLSSSPPGGVQEMASGFVNYRDRARGPEHAAEVRVSSRCLRAR